MSGQANAGKALTVTVEGTSYARIPIRTRVVMPGDDLDGQRLSGVGLRHHSR